MLCCAMRIQQQCWLRHCLYATSTSPFGRSLSRPVGFEGFLHALRRQALAAAVLLEALLVRPPPPPSQSLPGSAG